MTIHGFLLYSVFSEIEEAAEVALKGNDVNHENDINHENVAEK
jgi:hypothetical protein